MQDRRAELKRLLHAQWQHLVTINPSDRSWQMPFAAALATGLPLLIGVYLGRMDYGLVSTLGGLVFLYLPNTPLHHRMVVVMACAFAMIGCYTLGVMSQFFPLLMVPALAFTTMVVNMLCRFYGVGMPGSLFFVMAASIGAYTPVDVLQVPLMAGLMSMGTLLACLVAFFYSLYRLRLQAAGPVPPLPTPTFDFVVFDSVWIGLFVGLSLAIAQLLQLDNAYWVPACCMAIMQGATLQAVWRRKLHRLLGTSAGLLLAWALLSLPLNDWGIALTLMALIFVVETLIVRHYAAAVLFVTPMAILLSEAARLDQGSVATLIGARFVDTLLGSLVGLFGGFCLYSPRFREVTGRPMRWLVPQRTER